MPYSDEEIKKYMNILNKYTKTPEEESSKKTQCWNCKRDDCFTIENGFKICENCGSQNEHFLGYFDKIDHGRLVFRNKSIYQRKYHYEKKVDQVRQMIQLSEDEKYELYNKLMAIDNNVMEKLNKQFNRKRMISIGYLIKKILEEMGNKKQELIHLNIGGQTLVNYEKWWHSYKSLKQPLGENTSK